MSIRYEQNYIQNPHIFGAYHQNNYGKPHFHQRSINPNILNNNFLINPKGQGQIYQSTNLQKNNSLRQNNSQISYARNFKHRLFEADRNQQMKKQMQKANYRKQLQLQMKADKQRKERQKKQLQQWQYQRQKKFLTQVGAIKAKQPGNKKQQPSYFILRSSKGQRNKNLANSRLSSKEQDTLQKSTGPNINKRGGYHNQSSLDHTKESDIHKQNPQSVQKISKSLIKVSQKQQRQLQIVRQRNYEQERISSIIRMQQKMIKKLQIFKHQIIKTNKNLNVDKQLQHIRNVLKSKSIKLEGFSSGQNQLFQNNADFYHLPQISRVRQKNNQSNRRAYSRSHNEQQSNVRRKGINLNENMQREQLPTDSKLQRRTPQYNFQQNKPRQNVSRSSENMIRKREIKLFDRNSPNDKNIVNNAKYQIDLPVVNQNDNSANNQNQSRLSN